ncbi:50S ribosomal protein L21 [Simkania negevensis]|uniref:Large ribosomal subunit protein bL21 n=1 Tax=Simkania negevensis TaxID=83561 RepID=A0ABS3ARA9_9BACT|nr:50S ribosomal protein L21 [Simkania negevensis]
MYAIIQTGGKQYRVKEGDVIDVERLGDLETGSAVEFSEVLFFSDGVSAVIGSPRLDSCIVKGEALGEVKGPKVFAFKYKRRKNYRRKIGHRQKYSRVKITAIEGTVS